MYQPVDESIKDVYASSGSANEVQTGKLFINGSDIINYSSQFEPEQNLKIQSSPGQYNTSPADCETTYPKTVKYNNSCITEGDIPYGQVVNNKVNPRLVSRWESFTGDYSREQALQQVDGVLYPDLKVLTN
jgi:hypothetical protein